MNEIMRLLNVDPLLLQALREDMPGEDVSTNAVMPCACPGTVDLIAKQDGICLLYTSPSPRDCS